MVDKTKVIEISGSPYYSDFPPPAGWKQPANTRLASTDEATAARYGENNAYYDSGANAWLVPTNTTATGTGTGGTGNGTGNGTGTNRSVTDTNGKVIDTIEVKATKTRTKSNNGWEV